MNLGSSEINEQALTQEWDAIVVGTGMGGGTIGHRLARAGKKVLFCELGGSHAPSNRLHGEYPERAPGRRGQVLSASDAADLLRAGRYADTLVDDSHSRTREYVPFIGSGPGGSSALYGMALERFFPADFSPGAYAGDAPGASVVAEWPISYAELAPYYASAEALYRVRGDVDPLAAAHLQATVPSVLLPPPPMSAAAAELASFFEQRGLHPYRLPAACEFKEACKTCQGFLCSSACKNDAESICLRPAIQEFGASLLQGCRVLAVRSQGRRASGVLCHWAGRELALRARVVVLAAGALQSPLILMRSSDSHGHEGLGNASGFVGRNLMRHLIDLYLVRPRHPAGSPFDNRRKEFACNDFYVDAGEKLGTLQSFGRLPPADMLFGSLLDDLRASRWHWAAQALPLARPVLRPVLKDITENHLTLATIAEDLPYPANAIRPHAGGPGHALLHYEMSGEAKRRVARLRRHMDAVMRGRSWRRLAQADNNQRIAHVCGTCRFGNDPGVSVLDRDNRLHALDNLFIVDSSFFPSSGGTNPSLTVAANALRVGDLIADHLL